MSSLAFSLGLCTPRKLSTFTLSSLATNLHRTEATANLKVSSSRPEYQLLQLGITEGPISLSRRQLAVGVGVLSLGLTEGDVLLQTQPFSASAAPCELVLAPSGLAFCDQILGSGSQATKGQLIKAHYIGKLENGKVFDSSYSRGKPLTFRVGVGEVIKGWDQGILGGDGVPPMLPGGKRTLKLPPELGYGIRGAGCKGGSCIIPPDSVLFFDVEFIGKA
ncbi:hypothetical protein Nepgr_032877 [Nepenthes gracilis]|uniref:peptidylprolyl isomerase n=1 Tax=Nepenthes gracilis TaxID=150966 RepID=A0AAD3Y881_NEPGR|nr:hypothetical protein Nepgr_032877 [Nepenthes gracilis]